MVAIIGGAFARFRPLVDLYRQEAATARVPEARRIVGVHAVGFGGDTDQLARNAFYPGWHDMWAKIGPERGWPAPSREQFEALCAADGPYIVDSPATVASKLRFLSDALGGAARVNLQMSSASGDHRAMLHSVTLLGQRVKPMLQA